MNQSPFALWRLRAGLLGSCAVLLSAALAFTAPVAQAATKEVRANMEKYCGSLRLKYAGFNSKKKRHSCGVWATGFNTYYWTKLRTVNLSTVCKRQHGTTRWRYQGAKVWCLVEQGVNLRVCNRRNGPVWMTVGYWVSPKRRADAKGWVSQGWWKIEARKCRQHWKNHKYRGDVYFYANTQNGRIEGRDAKMCINTKTRFKIGYADKSANCRGTGLKRVGMYKFTVQSGNNTWNFR